MNRRLILMRHAKSAWSSGASSDHGRPLNKRGRANAPLLGTRLFELGWIPELVCSSDSARTRETWERMKTSFGDLEIDACFTPELYLAGLLEIRALSRAWDPSLSTALVLGHNPGFESALHELSGEPARMTTANAALLSGSGETWAKSLEGSWSLQDLLRPRELS